MCTSGDGSVCCRVLIYINSFKNAEVVTHTLPRQNTTNFNWFWEKYHLFSEPLLFKPWRFQNELRQMFIYNLITNQYMLQFRISGRMLFFAFLRFVKFSRFGPPLKPKFLLYWPCNSWPYLLLLQQHFNKFSCLALFTVKNTCGMLQIWISGAMSFHTFLRYVKFSIFGPPLKE